MSAITTADRLLAKRKFGIFTHFLAHNEPGGWDETVNNFDVPALAKNLSDIGAGWYFITLMQGRRYMCAPNAAFDAIAGTRPGEACATRDLPADIIAALKPRGIDFCLYFTGDGPYKDSPEGDRFGFTEPRERGVNAAFVQKWTSVLREYALRYGSDVSAWWIDGMYKDYLKYTDELAAYYTAACAAGNPDALVALNDGVADGLVHSFPSETMTTGEFNSFCHIPATRFIDGAQAHILAPLGYHEDEWNRWCKPGCQHTKEYMADYIRRCNDIGCLVTIDVGIDARGHIDPAQLELLAWVSANV